MRLLCCAVLACALLGGCQGVDSAGASRQGGQKKASIPGQEVPGVIAVDVDEKTIGRFTFSATVLSEEAGCDRYADWWEIITEDGILLSRRVLAHSHVDEQPFTRSAAAISLNEDATVIVRVHMQPTGYLPRAMQGTISDGFSPVMLPAGFAESLARTEPLPTSCAF